MTFDMIEAGIQNGSIDAESGAKAIQGALSSRGIKVDLPNPDAWKQALDNEYNQQKYQFALTHPDITDSDTMESEFNKYYNETIYGKPETAQYLSGERTSDELISDPAGQAALLAAKQPISLTGSSYIDDKGRTAYKFNVPIPSSGYINVDGTLYEVKGPVGSSPTNQGVTLLNVKTGNIETIQANKNVNQAAAPTVANGITQWSNENLGVLNKLPVVAGVKKVLNWLF
jgi:hypothetical protein